MVAAHTSTGEGPAHVRFGICGINDFSKLRVSRKPNGRSDPQRLFGAVSRRSRQDSALRKSRARKSAT
jgi:hypothetical protein